MINKAFVSIIIAGLVSSFSVMAQVELPKLISNGMVLQRDAEVRLWGWASPGEAVRINFKDQQYQATATENGDWEIRLKDLKAGGPYQMQIAASNQIVLDSVYIGDVWLCSGQSNMEIPMSRVAPLYEEEIASANNQYIRYFEVPKEYDLSKEREKISGGQWQETNRKNIDGFSAVSYFFGKNLYETYKVPIGLINSALGGSPVQAWLSEDALKNYPEYYEEAQRLGKPGVIDSLEQIDQDRIRGWYAEVNSGDAGNSNHWEQKDLEDSGWTEFVVPGYWNFDGKEKQNGVVWFRKKFEVSEAQAGQSAKLLLGRIVDADSVFVNGQFVGNTTYQYPPRRYEIPKDLLVQGENTISVKVLNERGRGGFVSDKPYEINFDDESKIELSGKWMHKAGFLTSPLQPQTFYRWKPEGLYNAMIHPIEKYHIKGVIWYQGESNTGDPEAYKTLFPDMIADWREKWGQQPEDFPFIFVQLANFMEAYDAPTDSNWARLREAQLETLQVPNTGMAVAIDVGEWNDIHPLNKKDVGDRLAQAAKNLAYGEEIVAGGPIFESYEVKGDSIEIHFKNVGDGLMAEDGELKEFAIAGKDQKFVWANARIEGDKIVVFSPKISNPVAVRYAWANNPENANLYNKEGLPASPFRTDDWELSR
ncbi:sialate O-acetylesterase [Christiangramia flava]|uniref:Sialic acid-specific 9-O-acetylesterase n=1 Tax=Christiangramia flava JLT2011 TaxID=1229726 RepID=A0A1L7I1H6_9FLAO|nr:sialate O-acetylesterase [Christiangramia flava]APU67044.1 Sialic acid-specific 9-O-acetylesterase [Christiangramia flava JLT2011]OSS38717.1 Sialic acid-specific 9-O-acetylesterase [Christiangramia flava JLT2011]